MNRFLVVAALMIGAGLVGVVQSVSAADENITIRQCAHGNYNGFSQSCDCFSGYHNAFGGGCYADPPWNPNNQTPTPYNPNGTTPPNTHGTTGGTGGPPPTGPYTKACHDCKAIRGACRDGAAQTYSQCEHDISDTAAQICINEQRCQNGDSCPNVVQSWEMGPPCVYYDYGTHACAAWTPHPVMTWSDTCFNSYMSGYEHAAEDGHLIFDDSWKKNQDKACHDTDENDIKKCNSDNPCETTACSDRPHD